ncbi:MAG TPA: hypothetical protein VE866_04805 [Candidatus Binatia bacterium]|nr:hypothetical protein [Candidatus Binatia bacterium]
MMTLLISVCIAAFLALLWLPRRNQVSLGLPIAYLYLLLLIHVPGAFAHVVGGDFLVNTDLIQIAMRFVAIGAVCFVLGVWWARRRSVPIVPISGNLDRKGFCLFCLIVGWVSSFGLSPLYSIPSVSAAVLQGGAVWMLGVLLGLRTAVHNRDFRWIGFWLAALAVYPTAILLIGGFLSYGAAAVVLVFSVFAVSVRKYWQALGGVVLFVFLSMSVFVTYYQHRNEIRDQVWNGAPMDARIDSVMRAVNDFQFLDPTNRDHLYALDARLNQNYFAGLAARRIEQGRVSYLEGESVWEGLEALVPRAFWPDKPVFAGSPQIVSKMTGLRFRWDTSIGVGNVMEFQINFGTPGVVVGFLLLGWLIGTLDVRAAMAERRGELGKVILYFLPCVALIQPNGSLVELFSGSAAALVGASVWYWAWKRFIGRKSSQKWMPLRSANRIEGPAYKHQSAS